MVKNGHRLDLDMDGYVPKEKQEEWKRILDEIPYRRLGLTSGTAGQEKSSTEAPPKHMHKVDMTSEARAKLLADLERAVGG